MLVDSAFAHGVKEPVVKRAIRLVLHRLSCIDRKSAVAGNLLLVLAEVIHRVSEAGRLTEASSIILFSFDSEVLKPMVEHALNDAVREGAEYAQVLWIH